MPSLLRGLRLAAVFTPAFLVIFGSFAISAEPASTPRIVAQAKAAEISDKRVETFAAAATQILDIREKFLPQIKAAANDDEAAKIFKKAQTEMRAVLAAEDLTEDQYNAVVDAARANPALAEKIQKIIDKKSNDTGKK